MNARTTSLLIVLALALAACVAPMPAPPVKAPTVPEMEQPLIPSAQTEQAQNMPAVTNPWAYPDYVEKQFLEHQQKVKDAQAARLLAEQRALTDKLMTGLPMQIRDDIAIYAAIKVAELETASGTAATTSTGYPDILRSVMEGQTTTTPYVLPEQMTTNPKQPAVQELDDMLKPVTLPASTMPVRDQSYLEEQDMAIREAALQTYEDMLSPEAIMGPIVDRLPASTMPVRDQWYLEEQAPATVPVKEPYWENFFEQLYREEMGYVQTAPNYVLPEQMTTNPKQPAVQELDDMLKPVPMPATAPAMEPTLEDFLRDIKHGR